MNKDQRKAEGINNMSAEEIWNSHSEFRKYDLESFITYNKNMLKLTKKRKQQINSEEASFLRDVEQFPRKTTTSRGLPFWHEHPASELLKNDETDGVAKTMKPKQLWKSRIEYQDFPLSVFRKHIYQERTKQLASPFWQHRRNTNAMKKMEEARKMMSEWHQVRLQNEMEGMVGSWERWNLRDV